MIEILLAPVESDSEIHLVFRTVLFGCSTDSCIEVYIELRSDLLPHR